MQGNEAAPLRCSFCNKSQRDVKKLIAGPTVRICNDCVAICNDILAEDGISAGYGPKDASYAAKLADEYLAAADDLIGARNYLAAAREVRSATLAALRGMARIDANEAANWSEAKVIEHILASDASAARLLQVEDRAHILLRVSVDGAEIAEEDVRNAAEVTRSLVAMLRAKGEEAAEKTK